METRERQALDKREVQARRKVERFVKDIAEGAAAFTAIKQGLAAAELELEAIEQERREQVATPVIALHPNLADEFRRQVANLRDLLAGGDDEHRRAAIVQVRALFERIVVNPSPEGRGVIIDFEGRLNSVLELAAGPAANPAMYVSSGAAWGTRTHDPIITNDVLYQLS